MIVAVASIKGSPGVTTTALALAAGWVSLGRRATLVEADPSGGDAAYRCATTAGAPPAASPSLVTLAAETRRRQRQDRDLLAVHTQPLACGVHLLAGVSAAVQSRALAGLWTGIATAVQHAAGDVAIDLGRFDPSWLDPEPPVGTTNNSAAALIASADVILLVAGASMASVIHLRNGIEPIARHLSGERMAGLLPVLVGPARTSARDTRELDQILATASAPVASSISLSYDPHGVNMLSTRPLVRGAKSVPGKQVRQATGLRKLPSRRTPLARSALALVERLDQVQPPRARSAEPQAGAQVVEPVSLSPHVSPDQMPSAMPGTAGGAPSDGHLGPQAPGNGARP